MNTDMQSVSGRQILYPVYCNSRNLADHTKEEKANRTRRAVPVNILMWILK